MNLIYWKHVYFFEVLVQNKENKENEYYDGKHLDEDRQMSDWSLFICFLSI